MPPRAKKPPKNNPNPGALRKSFQPSLNAALRSATVPARMTIFGGYVVSDVMLSPPNMLFPVILGFPEA